MVYTNSKKKYSDAFVRRMILAELVKAGSYRALGLSWGCSQTYLHDVVHQRRGIGKKILVNLGLTKVVTVCYLPKSN